MASRKMGATNTNTLLLVGGGILLVYLFTRPKAPVYPVPPGVAPGSPYYPPPAAPAGPNPTNTAITAGADIINNLITSIFG